MNWKVTGTLELLKTLPYLVLYSNLFRVLCKAPLHVRNGDPISYSFVTSVMEGRVCWAGLALRVP